MSATDSMSPGSMPSREKKGMLSVQVKSSSILLQNTLLASIRDEGFRLVDSVNSGARIALDPGVYQVSAILEDGVEHSELVRIKSGETHSVTLGGGESPESRDDKNRSPWHMAFQSHDLDSDDFYWPAHTVSGRGDIHVGRKWPRIWWVTVEAGLTSLPSVGIEIHGTKADISVPAYPYEGDCEVYLELSPYGIRPRARIPARRIVASAMEKMLLANELTALNHVLRNAAHLLQSKYEDPVGATLGALLLHKFGQLEEHKDWLCNLSRDFPWIPDAQVLLASVLLRAGSERDTERALELMEDAISRRLLFTETFSILLDLWRRLPQITGIKSNFARTRALESLAGHASSLDWDSLYLCRAYPNAHREETWA